MFVKRLRLAGFKSFAVPTVLEFDAGINVIVGPNGSGKSNIADAVAWVLGSQAPTSLRGGLMQDVIFAGSDVRPPLGIADVELTLDNGSRMLPLDVAEVTIARSADRSGASEYRINGAECRLLDVAELLSDAGIGRSLHAVVGQGRLDQVLQARPEDRRALIEEAAQIGKFRRRKERAVRRIERVEDNIARLTDVLVELRRALRPLKRQASAAALYSELMTEHRELRQRLMATELHRLAADEARADPEVESHRLQLLSDELAHVRARLETEASERGRLAITAGRAQELANGIGRLADRLVGLKRLAEERAATCAARLSLETEEAHRARIGVLEEDLARWENETAPLTATAAEASKRRETAAAAARRAASELKSAELRLADARAGETAAAEALVRAEGRAAASRSALGPLRARVAVEVQRRDATAAALASAAQNLAGGQEEVRALTLELKGVEEAKTAAEARQTEAATRLGELQREARERAAERAAAEARVATLEDVRRLLDDLPEAAARIEPLSVSARETVSGARVDEEHAAGELAAARDAIETVAGEVAARDEDLRRLGGVLAAATERVRGALRDHHARSRELASGEEELVRAREALRAAEQSAAEEAEALAGHRASVEEAGAARREAEKTVAAMRAAGDEAARGAREAEMEARSAEERALAARRRVEEAAAGIASARAALAGLARRRRALESAKVRAQGVAAAADEAHQLAWRWADEAEARSLEARRAGGDLEARLGSLRGRERELEEKLEEVALRQRDAEVRRAQARARSEALGERALEEWGLSLDELKARPPFEREEEDDVRDRVAHLEREMRGLGGVNPRAREEYEELAEREAFLVDQIDDLKASRRDLMKIVREVDGSIVAAFGSALEDVGREFEGAFERLFPGGSGRLKPTDGQDLLSSGVEIEARPPGKRLSKLSLLSGGERSLVAVAFLFAIFNARPSPFYLLDEVEAALDDINLERFLRMVQELHHRAQVLIVTHQKRTMEIADVLYGVTMGRDGVSTVIAQRMEDVTTPV